MIDLEGDVRMWRLHRFSAILLLGLMGEHFRRILVSSPSSPDAAQVAAAGHSLFFAGLAAVALFHAAIGLRLLGRLCSNVPSVLHRFSDWIIVAERWGGFALAGFLAVHLSLIALALAGVPALDRLAGLAADRPVKAAMAVVVAILVLHIGGGLRVLAHELLSFDRWKRPFAILGAGIAVLAGLAWAAFV